MKGALCTIDRPYAECFHFFDWMHHHIGSTHVCHHIFSRLPCYHTVEATRHIKAFLEPKGLYHYDGRSTLQAMWQIAKNCHYVHPSVLPARRREGAAAHDGGVSQARGVVGQGIGGVESLVHC